MKYFKKNYFFLFLFFSFLVFGEEGNYKHEQSSDLSLKSNQIMTLNKTLSKNLNKYFRKKSISEKEIEKFLFKKSYYRSEIIKTEEAYIIKNPVKIIFVFKGNYFFDEKTIRKLIKVDETKIGYQLYDFVETGIKNIYQRQGFLKVKVKKSITRKGWKEWIYLNISEGPRMRITELKIKGLLSKPNSYYENFIKNNSTDLIKNGFYSQKALKIGYENLISYLRSQGYLQSKIYSDRASFKGDKAFITIHLEEGPLAIIGDIQIQNTKAFPIWKILSHIQSRIQSILQVDTLQEDLNNIEQLYKSKGYLSMKIKNKDNVIKYTPGEKYASIVIQIDEGPRAFISKITVQGLKKAKEKMVRSLLDFKTGDILTPFKKEQSIKSLGATGLFIDVSLSEKITDNQFEVIVFVKERKPRSLRGGLGVNSQRGFTTHTYSEVTYRNLFGWGRAFIARGAGQVNLTRVQTFLEYDFSGRYKEVFIPGYAYEGNISLSQSKKVFNYSRDNINFVRKTQISFFINKNISDDLKMRWNILSFENRREACTRVSCSENSQQIGSTGFSTVWDRRDNIFNPLSGSLSSFTTEWSSPFLGSSADISFVKVDFQNQLYWTFIKDYTLGLTINGGLIHTIQNSQHIPVSRAFILGGQASVRGYDGNIEGERIPSGEFAPIETANEALRLRKEGLIENVLKSRYGLINIDIRFPVFEGVKGVLFYDLGAVYLEGKNKQILNYGHSVGLGFRYQTFLIPIGLDIAYKLLPKEGSDYRFHFSIGW